MKRLLIVAVASLLLAAGTAASAGTTWPQPNQVIGQIFVPKDELKTDYDLKVDYVQGTTDDAAIPGKLPVHYLRTGLPCGANGSVKTVVISGHHFTHPLPGDAHGVFINLDRLVGGDQMYLTCAKRFGGGRVKYIVASNRAVYCGHTTVGFYDCPPAVNLLRNWGQKKVYLITCIGDGYWRRIVTAFAATTSKP